MTHTKKRIRRYRARRPGCLLAALLAAALSVNAQNIYKIDTSGIISTIANNHDINNSSIPISNPLQTSNKYMYDGLKSPFSNLCIDCLSLPTLLATNSSVRPFFSRIDFTFLPNFISSFFCKRFIGGGILNFKHTSKVLCNS